MTDDNAATGAGLREFLAWAVQKGELNTSTGNAQRVAVTKVLETEDDPDAVNIRDLDIERALERFENRNRSTYSTGSLATYKTRFRNAVTMYLAWLDGDSSWKSVVKSRNSRRASSGRETSRTHSATSRFNLDAHRSEEDRSSKLGVATVRYQLPLRPDLLVEIELPIDLTTADAERVSAFVRSLAFDSHVPVVASDVATANEED